MPPTKRGSKRKEPPSPGGEGAAKPKRKQYRRGTCSAEGCNNIAVSGGRCNSHGATVKKYECNVEGCAKYAQSGGVCVRHGAERAKCSAEGCPNGAVRRGVCWRHGAKEHAKKCKMEGCTNVVQRDGVCIRHGAKRQPKPKCLIEGCANIAKKGGVCQRHGAKPKKCSAEGCTKNAQSGGVCISHGAKVKKYECKVEGCSNIAVEGGVCIRHGAEKKKCKVEGCTTHAKKGGVCARHGAKPKKCAADGCTKYAQNGGLCYSHGAKKPECSHDGCINKATTGGLCNKHGAKKCRVSGCVHSLWKGRLCYRHGASEKCSAEGCRNKAQTAGLCDRHYKARQQIVSDASDGGAGGQEGERATKSSTERSATEGAELRWQAELEGPGEQGESVRQAGQKSSSYPDQSRQVAPTNETRSVTPAAHGPSGDKENFLSANGDEEGVLDAESAPAVPPLPPLPPDNTAPETEHRPERRRRTVQGELWGVELHRQQAQQRPLDAEQEPVEAPPVAQNSSASTVAPAPKTVDTFNRYDGDKVDLTTDDHSEADYSEPTPSPQKKCFDYLLKLVKVKEEREEKAKEAKIDAESRAAAAEEKKEAANVEAIEAKRAAAVAEEEKAAALSEAAEAKQALEAATKRKKLSERMWNHRVCSLTNLPGGEIGARLLEILLRSGTRSDDEETNEKVGVAAACMICIEPFDAESHRSRVVCSAENGCRTFEMCRLCVFKSSVILRDPVVVEDTGDWVDYDPTVCPHCRQKDAFRDDDDRLPFLPDEVRRAEEAKIWEDRRREEMAAQAAFGDGNDEDYEPHE